MLQFEKAKGLDEVMAWIDQEGILGAEGVMLGAAAHLGQQFYEGHHCPSASSPLAEHGGSIGTLSASYTDDDEIVVKYGSALVIVQTVGQKPGAELS